MTRGIATMAAQTGLRARRPRASLLWALALLSLATSACQTGPPPTALDRGRAAFAEGHYAEAGAFFEEAERTQPGDLAPALHGQARVALVSREPEQALRLLGRVAKSDRVYFEPYAKPDYAQALFEAGKSRLARDQTEAAIKALEALRKIDPDHPGSAKLLSTAWTRHGQALAMHGRRNEAMTRFEAAMSLRPQDADAWVGAAEILIAAGRKKQALDLLANARRFNPSDGRVRALTVQAMGVY